MAKDKVYTADMGQPPMDPEVAQPTSKADKGVLALTRANQLIDEASDKRTKAQNLGKMYMGSDVSKASNTKRANMAEEDAEVLTERAKQYRKEAEGKKAGGMIRSSASSRADGCATKGKTRGKVL